MAYRLLPRAEGVLECSGMQGAGHQVAERFLEPITVPRFLEPKSGPEREKRFEESKEMIAVRTDLWTPACVNRGGGSSVSVCHEAERIAWEAERIRGDGGMGL